MKKLAFFLSALFVSAMAMADTVDTISVPLSSGTFANKQITWKIASDKIQIEQRKGSSSTDVGSTYISAPRVYMGHYLAFKSMDTLYTINKVILKVNSTYYGNKMVAGTSVDGNDVVADSINITANLHYTSGCSDTLINVGEKDSIFLQNVFVTSGKQLRPTSIVIIYTKKSSSTPSITASNVNFGIKEMGTSFSKEMTVKGENLTEAISYSWQTGNIFNATGSLTEEGGKLNLTIEATTEGDIKDSIILTSGATTVKYEVTATLVVLEGNGTKDDPYTVSDMKKMGNPDTAAWVQGVIVGYYSGTKAVAGVTGATDANIAIATGADTVSVQLPSGDVRDAINLFDNPENLGKTVKLYGDLSFYNGTNGLKNTSDYVIPTSPTALDETKAAATEDKKVMRDGQLIIIRDGVEYNAQGARR